MSNTHKELIKMQVQGAEKSKKQLKGVAGGLDSMAKSGIKAAGAYFGAQALLSAVRTSIDLFGQQEEAEKKLRFAAGDMTDALIKQAEALQKNTRFGDEAIIAQQAYLASIGLTETQIKDTISASLDLAAATGMSLESAVMNTSKTLSGMAGELGERLGPEFRNITPEALKAGEGIKFIAQQFGGSAQADAGSFAGKLDQMRNAAGDAAESLGEALAPMVIKIAGAMKSAAEAFQSFMQEATETDLERTIRQTKELGGNTTALELALNKVNMSEAMQNLGQDTREVSEIESEILAKQEAKQSYNRFNVDTQLKIAELLEGEVDHYGNALTLDQLRTEILMGRRTIVKDMNEEQLVGLIETARIEQENLDRFDEQIDNLETEKAQNIEINRLKLEKNAILEKEKAIVADKNKLEGKGTKDSVEGDGKKEKSGKKLKDKLLAGIKEKGDAEMEQIMNAGILSKKADIKDAISNSYTMAQEAYKALASVPVIGPALGAAAAAVAFAFGMKQVAGIKAAKYGADFVTDGPQMMMVGEGSGPEHVQVTPLTDPNIDGPQGQGMTLNISGNVMHESFIEDDVIPKIREGLRLGEEMGV